MLLAMMATLLLPDGYRFLMRILNNHDDLMQEDSDYITQLTSTVSAAVSALTANEDSREPGEQQAVNDAANAAIAYARMYARET